MEFKIETSVFGSCLTIVFLNKMETPPTPTVWVCANRAAYDKALDKLRSKDMNHIELVQFGHSHVQY